MHLTKPGGRPTLGPAERDQLPREFNKMTVVRTRELRMEALDGELPVAATAIQREVHSDVYVQGRLGIPDGTDPET